MKNDSRKYKVLILTNHSGHTSENSLYELSVKMLQHPKTALIDIVSGGNEVNNSFFTCVPHAKLHATRINSSFAFSNTNHPLSENLRSIDPLDYDLIWLRLPPPLSKAFLTYISTRFKERTIINNPNGIYRTGSKEFLMNFPAICPPMRVCRSVGDIIAFKLDFPIVLKPFRDYGGKGIIKIDGELVWKGKEEMSFNRFVNDLENNEIQYLGVKFLNNVTQGDKRIIITNGSILGATLRMPPKDSWICNVSLGGASQKANVMKEEREIVRTINPVLSKLGIVMYGVDTLVNDEGKRVMSEINTTSIGGLPQIAKYRNKPLVEKAIDLIWKYFDQQKQQQK